MAGKIHDEHPFSDPEEMRDAVRRFRGRLSGPVTVVTAGSGSDRAGITVSSLMVGGDAEAGTVHFVIGQDSYAWDSIARSGRFVVHVLDATQREMADVFAGVRPSPGGPFSRFEVVDSAFGPELVACGTRARCSLDGSDDRSGYIVAAGRIETVELSDLRSPLQWFRGGYGEMSPR